MPSVRKEHMCLREKDEKNVSGKVQKNEVKSEIFVKGCDLITDSYWRRRNVNIGDSRK